MKTSSLVFLACAVFALASLSSCSRHQSTNDQTISVSADDADMNAAISKARATLPDFWQLYTKHEHGESDFSLKVKITDKDKVEYFWVSDIEQKDGKILGTINNDPDIVQNVKLGDRITVYEPDISDWLYMRNGKIVGNYTIRPLFKQMPANEVEKYKQMLADP